MNAAIPRFPRLAPIALAHRPTIAGFVAGFDPYAEFDPTNLYCWSSKYRQVAQLNGNLVLRFREPATGEHFLSFLGTRAVAETVAALLGGAEEVGARPMLRLVPEVVVAADESLGSTFAVADDVDADYVLSVPEWADLVGSGFSAMRYEVRRFGRHQAAAFRRLDLCDRATQRAMLDLARLSAEQKGVAHAPATANELCAIGRLFALAARPELVGFGLVGEGALLGFLVVERRVGGQSIAQFWKADRRHRGAARYLLHRACVELRDAGRLALNMGQDLGIPGQAQAKHALRPRWMLRKYVIAPAPNPAPTPGDPAAAGHDGGTIWASGGAPPRELRPHPSAVRR